MINKINFTSNNIYMNSSIKEQMKNDEMAQIQNYADKVNTDIFVLEKTRSVPKSFQYSFPGVVYKTLFSKGGQIWTKNFNTGCNTNQNSELKDNEGVLIYKDRDSRLLNEDADIMKNIDEIIFTDGLALDETSKPYNGVVVAKTSGGKTAKMTYSNGLLTKNALFDKENKLICKQIYNHDSNGKMNFVFKFFRNGNWTAARILKTGEIIQYKNSWSPYRVTDPSLKITTEFDTNLQPRIINF